MGVAPKGTPHLLVVYDTMIFDHPEQFDQGFVRYSQLWVPWSMKRADLVVTMSERARRRLDELSGGLARVEVLRWRGSGVLREPTYPTTRHVLMLGASEPHKCQAAGVEATRLLRDKTGEDIQLDVVGPEARAESALRSALATHDPKGRWTRRLVDVPAWKKEELLDAAWVLLQPSLDEGFGLPLLEATEHGVAVVHSGGGAMSEVLPSASAGDGAPEHLAAAMAELLDPVAWRRAVERARHDCADLTPHAFETRIAELVDRLVST